MKLTKSQKAKADTSLNQIPALFKKMVRQLGPNNLDWGGGKFDKATDYLAKKIIHNIVYDPYCRNEEHNRNAMKEAETKHIGTVTLANVLNVIKSKGERTKLLKKIEHTFRYQTHPPVIYISTYEKRGDGIADKDLAQTNMKTKDYLPEIQKVFPLAKITLRDKIITVDMFDI